LLEKLLVFRGYPFTQYALIAMTRLKQKGIIWVVKKTFSKATTKFTRSMVTTASDNASIIDEVFYKRK
jgi:hypothetical protein